MRTFLSVFLLLRLFAMGQTTSSVTGTVRDQSRAPLPGVSVTLTDAAGATRTTTTDASGRYVFPEVPAGEYSVRAELGGFSPTTVKVTVAPGRSQVADLLIGSSQDLKGALTESPFTAVPVLYVTDRRRAKDAGFGADYSRERATNDDLQYGRAIVTIPKDHRLAELESPDWLHLEFRPDKRKHVTLMKSESVDHAAFYSTLKASAAGREVFVFIHGYNVTFEDALRRTGQLAYDLQFPGPAIAYTWPAEDNAARYLIAQSNVDWCKPHLVTFLNELAAESDATRIHVVVHSLGNRIFAHAVDAIVARNPAGRPLFHNVVMAAADIDVGEFRQLADNLKRSSSALTLYVSSTDKALKASKGLTQAVRVGQGGKDAVLINGIDTIDASDVDKGFFWDINHSYYGESRSVVGDMWELIRCGWGVTARDALQAVGTTEPRLWRLLKNGARRMECREGAR